MPTSSALLVISGIFKVIYLFISICSIFYFQIFILLLPLPPRHHRVNRIKESEFMQFADVENHDDFYYHKDHRIHVRDQIGCWIVYDCALQDYK